MKKLFAGAAILGLAVFASAQTITFDKTTWDYGTVVKGTDGERFFTVTNTGDKPLIISNVHASCGCTTPDWDKSPILPGKSAKVKVGYNTQLVDPNGFQKMIEVYSNDPQNSRSVIYIKGKVVDASTAELAPEAKAASTKMGAAQKAVPQKATLQKKAKAK